MSARPRIAAAAAVASLLAALSLGPTFADGRWFWPVAGAVLTVALAGAAARRLGAPRGLVPVVAVAALVGYLTWAYARDPAVWKVFPGPAAWRELGALADGGLEVMNAYAAPVPVDPGLVLIAAAGVGLVAIAVDTLAVAARSAALAGLPLLALYAVPVAVVRNGVPWVLFLLGALGWLSLLLAEGRERLSLWGRALGRRTRADGRTAADQLVTLRSAEPLGVVGRRIGAAALGVAILVPALVPGLDEGVFGRGGGSGSGAGGGRVVITVNPYVTLRGELDARDNTEVFRYRVREGGEIDDYLRLVTLDTFDGNVWKPAVLTSAGRATDDLPAPPGADGPAERRRLRLSFDLRALDQTWLPLPHPYRRIDGLGSAWVYDSATRDVFALRGGSLDETYDVEAEAVRPTPAQLRSSGRPPADLVDRYTRLPDDLPASVDELALALTAGRTTDYDRALALQRFFLDPVNKFRYQTDVPNRPGSPVVAFLQDRQGFCQQFAGTFAVLARSIGLPTRVTVGFTAGTRQGQDGTFVVNRRNTHAWPEVYFDNAGWVRFEPTPGPTGIQVPRWAPGVQDGSGGPSGGGGGAISPDDPSSQLDRIDREEQRRSRQELADAQAASGASGPRQGLPVPLPVLVTLLVAVALQITPVVARRWRRRRRLRTTGWPDAGAQAALAAWQELADTGQDLGDPWPASRTPRATAAVLGRRLPTDAGAALDRLAHVVERVRYAAGGDRFPAVAADARTVLAALEAGASRRARVRAVLLPASVLAVAAGRIADALDAVDRWGERSGQRLRGLLPRRAS